MRLQAKDVCRQLGIDNDRLEVWIEAGCVRPRRLRGNAVFSETDRARIELILDLSGPMGVNDDGVVIILDLLDQIHGLRHALKGMSFVVSAQPPSIRQHIRSDVRRNARPKHSGEPNGRGVAGA